MKYFIKKTVGSFGLFISGMVFGAGLGVGAFTVTTDLYNAVATFKSFFVTTTGQPATSDNIVMSVSGFNVGVGVLNPTKKLQVRGSFQAGGDSTGRRFYVNSLGTVTLGKEMEEGSSASADNVSISAAGDIITDKNMRVNQNLIVTGNIIVNNKIGLGLANPTADLELFGKNFAVSQPYVVYEYTFSTNGGSYEWQMQQNPLLAPSSTLPKCWCDTSVIPGPGNPVADPGLDCSLTYDQPLGSPNNVQCYDIIGFSYDSQSPSYVDFTYRTINFHQSPQSINISRKALVITGGRLGIGVDNPTSSLQVSGNTIIGGDLKITQGRLGIGVGNPIASLHVNGPAVISGNLQVNSPSRIISPDITTTRLKFSPTNLPACGQSNFGTLVFSQHLCTSNPGCANSYRALSLCTKNNTNYYRAQIRSGVDPSINPAYTTIGNNPPPTTD